MCNTPAILIPYPFAADSHQDVNAAYAAKYGAALIIHQSESGIKVLKRTIKRLIYSHSFSGQNQCDDLLCKMRKGMDQIAVRDAHLRLVDILKKNNE